MYLEGATNISPPQGEGRHKKNKVETPKQPEREFGLRKTYSLDLEKITGRSQKIDFNPYNFFIDKNSIFTGQGAISFDDKDKMVYIGGKEMTILEFLVSLGIGLQEGAFKIQEYVLSSPEDRAYLEDPENLPN